MPSCFTALACRPLVLMALAATTTACSASTSFTVDGVGMASSACQALLARRDNQVTAGMTEDQVRAVLGAPGKVVDTAPAFYSWQYDAACAGNGPTVNFDRATRRTL